MRTLEATLEAIKQQGHYAVTLYFGEDIGADDLDVPLSKRRMRVIATPVGVIGEARKCWNGSLEWLLEAELFAKPTVLSNPPQREDLDPTGIYLWGTDSAVAALVPGARR